MPRRRRCWRCAAPAALPPLLLPFAASAYEMGECIVQSQIGTNHSNCTPGTPVPPGTVCEVKVLPGYNCSYAGEVVCDKNRTTWWNGQQQWSISCHPHKCTSGPFGPSVDPHAMYSSCTAVGATGTTCNPTCNAKYHLPPPTPHQPGFFTLRCLNNLSYDAAGYPPVYRNRSVCEPDRCLRGPRAHTDPHADYAACTAMHTDDTCVPACAAGYTPVGRIALRCDEKKLVAGGGYDAAGATCRPNRCARPARGTADPLADYSRCVGARTAQTCVPACPKGYRGAGRVLANLSCSARGEFDASAFRCAPDACGGGAEPGTTSAGVDVSHCAKLRTGDRCAATCITPGYSPRPAGNESIPFRLLCTPPNDDELPPSDHNEEAPSDHDEGEAAAPTPRKGISRKGTSLKDVSLNDTFDASAVACEPNNCSGGTVPPAHANLSACDAKHTGDVCTPRCDVGYVSNVDNFTLLCVANGTRPAMFSSRAVRCLPEKCEAPERGTTDPDANYSACIGRHTGDSCALACPKGRHYTKLLHLNCADGSFDAGNSSGVRCTDNVCRPPRDRWVSFNFTDPKCTTVAACLKAGVKCMKGSAEAPAEYGGIQLGCPVWHGEFVPTGCNEEACPENAGGRIGGECHCNAGFTGHLVWRDNRWAGACVPPPTAPPSARPTVAPSSAPTAGPSPPPVCGIIDGSKGYGTVQLECATHGDTVVAVEFADWGTPAGSCGKFADKKCSAQAKATAYAVSECVGKSACSLKPWPRLGDPCPGHVKRFVVQLRCAGKGAHADAGGGVREALLGDGEALSPLTPLPVIVVGALAVAVAAAGVAAAQRRAPYARVGVPPRPRAPADPERERLLAPAAREEGAAYGTGERADGR